MQTLKRLLAVLAMGAMAMAAVGCDPVRDPWVQDQDQLAAERARSAETNEALNIRLRAIQADR